ncbi:MAG TPA: glycosyltransferase [Acidimicrobiales bacterium]
MPTGAPQHPGFEPPGRRIGVLSTYPPSMCGLATFATALENALTRAGDRVTGIAINDGREAGSCVLPLRHELVNGSPVSVRETAQLLSQGDVAIIQHEYGIYGGADGQEVIDVLLALAVPAIVILHTVPSEPSAHQRSVLETVSDLAARVVVMTDSAGIRLTSGYAVDASKVVVIPHGASTAAAAHPAPRAVGAPAHLLTWGLLGPGKGIEHVIRALASLEDLRPRVRYTVAGATHPKVLARDGDAYRESLVAGARRAGVARWVTFDDTYREVPELMRFVSSASLVVLPYDSRDQATSGVLVDAIAAGRPVIATAFPHAVELLSSGAGIIVPHRDPRALAAAIRAAVTDPEWLEAMAARAREIAPSLSWDAVARQYQDLCDELAPAAVVPAHD